MFKVTRRIIFDFLRSDSDERKSPKTTRPYMAGVSAIVITLKPFHLACTWWSIFSQSFIFRPVLFGTRPFLRNEGMADDRWSPETGQLSTVLDQKAFIEKELTKSERNKECVTRHDEKDKKCCEPDDYKRFAKNSRFCQC